MQAPNMVLQVARSAQRRLMLARVVSRAGAGVSIGAATGAIGLLVVRAWSGPGNAGGTGASIFEWAVLFAPAAFGGAAGAAMALVRGPSLLRAAQRLDAQLNTKDVVASSVGLAGDGAVGAGGHDAAFVDWLHADAERAAGRVARAAGGPAIAPVRFGATWWGGFAMLVAGAAVCVWAPQGPWLRGGAAGALASTPRERREAAAEIARVREAVRPVAAANGADGANTGTRGADPALERAAARLEEIERELSGGQTDVPRAQSAAANATATAAGELRERAESERTRVEDARDRLREAAAAANAGRDADGRGEPSALVRAMERGDVEAAKAATDALAKAMQGMSAADRELVANELSRMAEAAKKREAAARAPGGPSAAQSGERASGAGEASPPSGQEPPSKTGETNGKAATTRATQSDAVTEKRSEAKSPGRDAAAGAPKEQAKEGAEGPNKPAESLDGEHAAQRAREPSLGEALEQAAKEMREPVKPASGEPTKPNAASTNSERDATKPDDRKPEAGQSAVKSDAPQYPSVGGGRENQPSKDRAGEKSGNDASEQKGESRDQGAKSRGREGAKGQREPARPEDGAQRGDPSAGGDKQAKRTFEPAKPDDAKGPDAGEGQQERPRAADDGRAGPGGIRPGEGKDEKARGEAGTRDAKDSANAMKEGTAERKEGAALTKDRALGDAKREATEPKTDQKPGDRPVEMPGGKLGEGLGEKIGEKLGEKLAERPDESGPPGELPPLPSAEALKALRDRLGSMKNLADKAKQNEKLAKGLEDKAREMFEKASPRQREQLRKMAEDLAKGMKPDGRPEVGNDLRDGQGGRGDRTQEEKRLDGGDMPGAEARGEAGQDARGAAGKRDEQAKGQGEGGLLGGGGMTGTPPRWAVEPGRGGGQVNPPRSGAKAEVERTELVDARGKGSDNPKAAGRDRVVAEWLGEPGGKGKVGGGEASPEAMKLLREAAASGQKAIEERTVPPRFDGVLRKYFQRLPEAVGGAPPKTPEGKAAEPK